MKRIFPKLIVPLVLLATVGSVVGEQSVSLFEKVQNVSSADDFFSLVRSLSKEEIFDFCNLCGTAVDNGSASAEGSLTKMAISFSVAMDKWKFTPSDFLGWAGDKTASTFWRGIAIRYSRGWDSLVEREEIDPVSQLRFYSSIIRDSSEKVFVRGEACEASARVLEGAYYMAACGSMEQIERTRVWAADNESCQIQDKRAIEYIDMVLALSQEKTTPEELVNNSIPTSLHVIIMARGPKVPRLKEIQELGERGIKNSNENDRIAFESLMRGVRNVHSKDGIPW